VEMGEGVTGPGIEGADGHPEDCVFCAESPRQLKGYKTKHGALKDEAELEKSLWSDAQEITSDSKVGPIYPLPGGNDPTTGWVARAGALEDFEVEMGAAPHHIIPGKAAMAKSSLERWTRAEKGQIKEDIGYSIDCASNGIFLPHVPVIYWTRHKLPEKVPMSEYYGQTWRGLSDSSKQSIGYLVMLETWLQMHYTDHRTPYDPGSAKSYDLETKGACDRLGDLAENHHRACERSRGEDKHYPPYSLVHRINAASTRFRQRITGRPDRWMSWVSPLARSLSKALTQGRERMANKGMISRKARK
jgi:hypothetical protein